MVDDSSLQSVLDAPDDLFSLGGEPLLIQGNFPSDSLPGGRFWLVEYQGLVEVDLNVGPAGRGMRPAASMLLFEKSPVAIAEDRLTELTEALWARTQKAVEYFWAMAPIAVKYGGRGHTRLAVAQCALLEQAFVNMWRAVNHPAGLNDEFHQNRLIEPALDELLPRFGSDIDAPATLTVVSLFCVRAESLHPALQAIGVTVPEKMATQVTRMLRVAMDEARRGGTGPKIGSRR